MEFWCNCTVRGKAEVLEEKPVPQPLFCLQMPHGPSWKWTRASALRNWQLAVWPMTRPC